MKGLRPLPARFSGMARSAAWLAATAVFGCSQGPNFASEPVRDTLALGGTPVASGQGTQLQGGAGGAGGAGASSGRGSSTGTGGEAPRTSGGAAASGQGGSSPGGAAGSGTQEGRGAGGTLGQGGSPRGAGGAVGASGSAAGGATGPKGAGGAAGQPRTGGAGGANGRGGLNAAGAVANGAGGSASGAASGGRPGTGGSAGRGGAAGTGGASGGGSSFKFMLGADVSSVDEAMDQGARYADTDGTSKPLLEILKNHGFNFIRLRTFVKPGAKYGYSYGTGGSCVKSEPYCDKDHTVAFAKQVKNTGMGLLLDLHYSDNWADPGNQIIPEDWRGATSVAELASFVKDYTKEVVSALADAGAKPDMVQVGNEITPGMLVHVPNSNTDCWGNNVSTNSSVNGSTSNWTNLGKLLKAGVEGVKEVDPSIKAMVHIENTKTASAVVSWVRSALNQGVSIDVLGLSCYVAYQGEPTVWQNTFTTLASTFPELSFVIAEYNPQRTQANRIMHDLPNGRGLGTFFWEPTQSGDWGSSLFTASGSTLRAKEADFKEFDDLKKEFGL